MNQVVVFYNPFLPELKISVNGKKLSPYSSLMSFQHQRLEKWSDCLFTELYREVNSDYEMLCVSNEFTCEWLEELAHRSSHCISFMSQSYPIFAYRGIIIPLLCSYQGGPKVFHPPMSKHTWFQTF